MSAQDFSIDPLLIDRCRADNAGNPMDCVGSQMQACFDSYGAGPNIVLSACMEAEAIYWDAALNDTYSHVLELARAEESDPQGLYVTPEALSSSLRGVQRAWISYRDAVCDYEVALAMPFGSAVGPAANGCIMRETARQVFELERMARGFKR